MTRVTFVGGPLDGQTRDMDVVPERVGDYFRIGPRYRYDPEGRLGREVNRQCCWCYVVYDDHDDATTPCPRCGSKDTTDEITTLYRGKRPEPRPGPPPT